MCCLAVRKVTLQLGRSAWRALILFLCCADCGLVEAGPGEETPVQPPAPPTATTGELFPWDDVR